MFFVFSWWLYSFISLVSSEYKLEKENLNLTSLLVRKRIITSVEQMYDNKAESPYDFYLNNIDTIKKIHANLNQEFAIMTHLSLADTNAYFTNMISVSVVKEEFDKIQKRYLSKKRTYYSEVLFFGLLVIIGSIWIYSKLEKLLNLNKIQNNFLLSVTHELKTPITAIKLSSQTLINRKLEDDVKLKVQNQILQNADRLNDLIDNVLLANNIDGNIYEYKFAKINLNELINTTSKEVFSSYEYEGEFIFNESEQEIYGDYLALKLVFSNLLNNSIKYAGQNSQIKVVYQLKNKELCVKFSDNGSGIDENEFNNIFNKFYRVGDENTRSTKGTGLGLFIVKEILKAHNAKIEVENILPHGAQFIIKFKK
ncbi:MAG: HAMP domain-containing sensor histidine kinase [Bacteroidota bacterium]|nr:HAMP domain-containing sensor histidine kinase [Bacteroidota bacterium]